MSVPCFKNAAELSGFMDLGATPKAWILYGLGTSELESSKKWKQIIGAPSTSRPGRPISFVDGPSQPAYFVCRRVFEREKDPAAA
jgi:hypothetical protein